MIWPVRGVNGMCRQSIRGDSIGDECGKKHGGKGGMSGKVLTMTDQTRHALRLIAEVFPGTTLQMPDGSWKRIVLNKTPPPSAEGRGAAVGSEHVPTTTAP